MVRTYGFLSTYPPTQCGLATFTASLLRHLTAATPGSQGRVVRVHSEPVHEPVATMAGPVVHEMAPGATEALNSCDLVVVQHEYTAHICPPWTDLAFGLTWKYWPDSFSCTV
jgi:hypothetical protein